MRALLVVTLLTAAASAEERPPKQRTGEVLLVGGSSRAAGDDWGGAGVHVGYFFPLGHSFRIGGEYEWMILWGGGKEDSGDTDGYQHRLGLTARWQAARMVVDDRSAEFAMHLEVGAGMSFPQLDDGTGERSRDALLGWALEIRGRDREKGDGRRTWGVWFGGRVTFTEASGQEMLGCAGPCDAPSDPSGYATGIMVLLGGTWGR
jgi:hypothetical protein